MPERLGRVLSPEVTEKRRNFDFGKHIREYLPMKNLDFQLVLITLFLCIVGIAIIYSATMNIEGESGFFKKQIANVLIGIVGMALMMTFDYRRIKVYTFLLYGICIFFLIVVFAMPERMGSQRWIPLGFYHLQPSEFAKLMMILLLAYLLSDETTNPASGKSFIRAIAWSMPIVVLVFFQPDLGTTLVFGAIILSMLFLSGCNIKYWFALIGSGTALFAAAIFFNILKPYQVDRLTAFLNPAGDPGGAAYQINQSKIAIGSGQFMGKGFGSGTQTGLEFVPFRHTDFVFSVVGEEFGHFGAVLLLAVFCSFLWKGMKVANSSRDFYGMLIAMGIVSMFVFEVVVNIGMTVGLMPVTGVALPFISYGGSSMLLSMMAVGLLLNINMRRFAQI